MSKLLFFLRLGGATSKLDEGAHRSVESHEKSAGNVVRLAQTS